MEWLQPGNRTIWSHRCRVGHGDNSLEGCKKACSEFTGVEIDIHYDDGIFYMHHDFADPNAARLKEFAEWYVQENQTCGLWVDLKTSNVDSIEQLANITEPFDELLVEVYKKKMIYELNKYNITSTSSYLDTDFHSIWIFEYILFSTSSTYFGTWYADWFCLLDTFFDSGGSLALTDKPVAPEPCENYWSIETWRVLTWLTIIFIFILLMGCLYMCCRKKTETGYNKVNQS